MLHRGLGQKHQSTSTGTFPDEGRQSCTPRPGLFEAPSKQKRWVNPPMTHRTAGKNEPVRPPANRAQPSPAVKPTVCDRNCLHQQPRLRRRCQAAADMAHESHIPDCVSNPRHLRQSVARTVDSGSHSMPALTGRDTLRPASVDNHGRLRWGGYVRADRKSTKPPSWRRRDGCVRAKRWRVARARSKSVSGNTLTLALRHWKNGQGFQECKSAHSPVGLRSPGCCSCVPSRWVDSG